MPRPLKLMSGPLSIASAALLAGCGAGIQRVDTSHYSTVSLEQLRTEPQRIGLRKKGDRLEFPRQGLIVRLPAGATIPLRLVADISLASLVAGENQIRIKRELFLLIDPKRGVKLSPDGQRWADMGNLPAISKLFGTRGRGSFRIGFGASKKEGVFVEMAVHKPARR